MTEHKTLYLIRGLAGSGKTTLANAITPFNCAADMMPGLYDEFGYISLHLQKEAHQWCYRMIEKLLSHNYTRVAVHNTFVYNEHIEPYKRLALKYGYRFQVIHCESQHGNIHNVPDVVQKRWKDTWENYEA